MMTEFEPRQIGQNITKPTTPATGIEDKNITYIVTPSTADIDQIQNEIGDLMINKVVEGVVKEEVLKVDGFEGVSKMLDYVEASFTSNEFVEALANSIIQSSYYTKKILDETSYLENYGSRFPEIQGYIDAYKNNAEMVTNLLEKAFKDRDLARIDSMIESEGQEVAEKLRQKVLSGKQLVAPITGTSDMGQTRAPFSNEGLIRFGPGYPVSFLGKEINNFMPTDILQRLVTLKAFILLQKETIQRRILESEKYKEISKELEGEHVFNRQDVREKLQWEYVRQEISNFQRTVVRICELYLRIDQVEYAFKNKIREKLTLSRPLHQKTLDI